MDTKEQAQFKAVVRCDVEEVGHGRWVYRAWYEGHGSDYAVYECIGAKTPQAAFIYAVRDIIGGHGHTLEAEPVIKRR